MKTFNKRLGTTPTQTTSGLKFVMSTPSVDRVGDRVMPSWDLSKFLDNPIALAFHDHAKIIGKWSNLHIAGTDLVGTLELAKSGTSALVDEIRSLVEQGILKTVSIGFSSGRVVENEFGGYDLHDNHLMECSLVAVPANAEALRKSLSKHISSDELNRLCSVNGNCPVKSSEDNTSVNANQPTIQTKTTKGKIMTIAERIIALQTAMTAKQVQLATLNSKADLSDADVSTMANLSTELAQEGERLKSFEAMEKTLIPANMKKVEDKQEPTISLEEARSAVIKSVVAMTKSAVEGTHAQAVIDKAYGGSKVVSTFVKSATNPATIGDDAWAGNLVQDGYGSYLEDLVAGTIFGRVGAQSVTFGKMGSLTLPFRNGNGSLSGAFIEEGAPIPVKADAYSTIKISPFKLGVISVFSKELFRKSIPNIEALVRTHIQTDTADVIDATFLDAVPADATRPAGLEASAGAGNIVASTGATVENILADFNGVFDRLTTAKLGGAGTILIHPSRLRGMRLKTDALGNFVFKDVDVLTGFTFEASINVPADKVYVVDNKALIKGIGNGVEFEANSSATIVMGDPAEAINDGTTATALPVRSLYQTDSTALRMTMDVSWLQTRADGVQILTGVSW